VEGADEYSGSSIQWSEPWDKKCKEEERSWSEVTN